MRIWLVVVALLGLEGQVQAQIGGTFTLERLAERDWRATYCFDEPVLALAFTRRGEGIRRSSWISAEDGLQLVFTGDQAKLQHPKNNLFSCAAVSFKTDTRIPEKNYMAFSTFSDGGVSVYTGYLLGQVYKDGDWREMALRASYKGLPEDKVITRNPAVLGAQFVYFGKLAVRQTPAATLVIDPAMPSVARLGVLSAVPRANEMLKILFGYSPKEPYLVFMAAGELETSPSDHTKAGTQPYQILFTMKGKGAARWADSDPLYFPQFTMHEVVHIWQKDVWGDSFGPDTAWVDEGAADALSHEMMARTGAYRAEKYAAVWKGVESRCRLILKETSIHGAAEAGRFDAFYQCGALINRLVGEALNPVAPGEGLIDFWRAMMEWDRETLASHKGEALFFLTMQKLGLTNQQVVAVKNFLATKPADPGKAISALRLTLLGVGG